MATRFQFFVADLPGDKVFVSSAAPSGVLAGPLNIIRIVGDGHMPPHPKSPMTKGEFLAWESRLREQGFTAALEVAPSAG